MAKHTIEVNRAPVLTLWAAVVAKRLGYDWDEALTLGRALAGLNAQSKGRRLGIYEPAGKETKERKAEERPRGAISVELLGRAVPAVKTDDGVRALSDGKPDNPPHVEHYLRGKFGDGYEDAREAMETLAKSYGKDKLASAAYGLYETFRPSIPKGKRGWGAKGELDLEQIKSMAKT